MPKAASIFGYIEVHYEAASGVIEGAVALDLGAALGRGALNGRRCVFLAGARH